jgi:hydroxymethylbilane synthase
MSNIIRIGTRGSSLALKQTNSVIAALREKAPGTEFVVKQISSVGDQQADAPLESLGIGVFTKTIETALLDGKIDVAVHSLKDLPTETTEGLLVMPVLEREDPRDILIDRWDKPLIDLPEGARIGTSSPRRAAQLRHGRKDVEFLPIRGNVETRIRKAAGPDYDGTVLAAAGVRRLGLEASVTEYLSPHICTPAPGQAAIAAQLRTSDSELLTLVRSVVHRPTLAAVEAERAILRAAGGGCQLPIGALAEVKDEEIRLFATVTATDGSKSYRVEVTGPADEPDLAGKAAYQELLAQGAGDLMHGVTT